MASLKALGVTSSSSSSQLLLCRCHPILVVYYFCATYSMLTVDCPELAKTRMVSKFESEP